MCKLKSYADWGLIIANVAGTEFFDQLLFEYLLHFAEFPLSAPYDCSKKLKRFAPAFSL